MTVVIIYFMTLQLPCISLML